MLDFNTDACLCSWNNILYLITHAILIILVLISIYNTGKMFLTALKLNTEKDYFNKELEKYIYDKVLKLETRASNKESKKHKNEEIEFREFIKKQEMYFNDETKIKDKSDYEAIYPIKNGIIGNYDYKKLNDLANYFINQKISEENYITNNKNIIFIPNNIGKKISKKDPIFYCLKQYKNIFKNLNDTIIYTDNRLFIDDEIKLINNCLFNLVLF